MKRQVAALMLGAWLLAPTAQAALTLNGAPLEVGETPIYEGTTYVPIRAISVALCPTAQVSWEGGEAVVRMGTDVLTARPGERALYLNGDAVALSGPVRLEEGRTLVPIRPLAAILKAEVDWSAETGVSLTTERGGVWGEEDVYWLARIISAESRGEPWEGKIAVGNVVLNRVKSPDFPNTIYEVIFDDRWGGQFEPVRNGTVYQEPTAESLEAAVACLAGENTAGESLYFLAPALTDNHWTMNNRTYYTTIGVHWFYL